MSMNNLAAARRRRQAPGEFWLSDSVSRSWIGPILRGVDLVSLTILCPLSATIYLNFAYEKYAFDLIYVELGFFVAFFTVIICDARGLYRRSIVLDRRVYKEALTTWTLVFAGLSVTVFLLALGSDLSRGVLIVYYFNGCIIIVGARILFRNILERSTDLEMAGRRRVFLIAESNLLDIDKLTNSLSRHGYTVIDHVLFDSDQSDIKEIQRRSVDNLGKIVRSRKVDEVMLAVDWSRESLIARIAEALVIFPVPLSLLPDRDVSRFVDYTLKDIGLTKAVELTGEPLDLADRLKKRALDLVLGTVALIALSPLMIVVAGLIKLDSRGPVLFRQRRTGFNGREFRIFKFRTMRTLEDGPVIRQATRDDTRITRIGRWLRASSVDELPQLLNVLAGDMSLVGPRPHAIAHDNHYDRQIAHYAMRHHVKPGITGWAQVNGLRGETPSIDLMLRRVEHDLWYINNWSVPLDIKILLYTALMLMRPQNAY